MSAGYWFVQYRREPAWRWTSKHFAKRAAAELYASRLKRLGFLVRVGRNPGTP